MPPPMGQPPSSTTTAQRSVRFREEKDTAPVAVSRANKRPRISNDNNHNHDTNKKRHSAKEEEEYDSDDLMDSVASAAGAHLAVDTANDNDDDNDDDDEYVKKLQRLKKQKQTTAATNAIRAGYFQGEEAVDQSVSLLGLLPQDSDNGVSEENDTKHVTTSTPVEPFNLNAEREDGEGYFDGETYVFRKSALRDEEPDAWVDGLIVSGVTTTNHHGEDENATTATTQTVGGGTAGSSRIERRQQRTTMNDTIDHESTTAPTTLSGLTRTEKYQRLHDLLASHHETVFQALSRHGAILKRTKKSHPPKKSSSSTTSNNMTTTTTTVMTTTASASQQAISQLTELADGLLMEGDTQSYDRTKSQFHQLLLSQTQDTVTSTTTPKGYFDQTTTTTTTASNQATSSSSSCETKDILWEYKGNQDGAIHGPYPSSQMQAWIAAGYFVGSQAVDIRIMTPNHVMPDPTVPTSTSTSTSTTATAITTDHLMADLLDSDDDENDEKETSKPSGDDESPWIQSDQVDFSSYL